MAIIRIVSTRKVENSNLSFGKGTLGALTVTGEIYDAEEYKALYIDPNTGIPNKADLSATLIKCVGTVSFAGDKEGKIYEAIQQKIEDYFTDMQNRNIFQIKVGLVIKSSAISKPVDGVHPELGTPTKTVLINNATLIEVEEPTLLEMAEDLVESTTEARETAKQNSATGLTAYLANKAAEAKKVVEEALLGKDETTSKKSSKTKVSKVN